MLEIIHEHCIIIYEPCLYFQMELQKFETEYLHDKDLSYFEDYDTTHKLTAHVYIADTMQELQETLEELNLPAAMVYNPNTNSFERQVIFLCK